MSSDRTEKATPKRREDARKRGQIARRPELSAAIGFFAGLLMLRSTSDDLMRRAKHLFTSAMSRSDLATAQLTISSVHQIVIDAASTLALLVLPIVAAALVAGVIGNFIQGGLTLTPGALSPRAERFNPVANLKRVFGSNGPVELLKSLFKLGGIVMVCYGVFVRGVMESPALVGATPAQTFAAIGHLIYELSFRAGGVLLLIAAFDYGYGWYKHEKSLRMTKQEIKDEYRQQEGDPFMKGQRRRAARALTQRRMMSEVPRASVIVTNPTHFAVALRYDRDKDAAPTVVAKGADLMAKRIREIALANDVAIVENPPLARTLYHTVEMGRTVPLELFRAVAELLAYVYRQRERAR